MIRVVDDNSHQTLTSYDTSNRPLTATDHRSNSVTRNYDENSNVIQITELDKSDLLSPDETFITIIEY